MGKNLLEKLLILEIFEEGGRRCSSRLRENGMNFCECVCVLCLAESKKREERSEALELICMKT